MKDSRHIFKDFKRLSAVDWIGISLVLMEQGLSQHLPRL